MKYWEMIADNLSRKGWSVGWFKFTSTIDGRQMWSADAWNGEGPQFIVRAEELGSAFLGLETQCGATGNGMAEGGEQ